MHEFVVPKSIPMVFAIRLLLLLLGINLSEVLADYLCPLKA
jgi:hypothetical protein